MRKKEITTIHVWKIVYRPPDHKDTHPIFSIDYRGDFATRAAARKIYKRIDPLLKRKGYYCIVKLEGKLPK